LMKVTRVAIINGKVWSIYVMVYLARPQSRDEDVRVHRLGPVVDKSLRLVSYRDPAFRV
jgi:hypothetical protein